MRDRTREIVRRLAERAEEVCRHYLSNGRKVGGYWIVGDRHNAKGRSLYVRLRNKGSMIAGKWTDASTAQHGDLLDIIATSIRSTRHSDALDEAERFLGVSRRHFVQQQTAHSSIDAARRLFAAGGPIAGTLADRYLRSRGIAAATSAALRFHPRCFYRAPNSTERLMLPALLSAVTDNAGHITGVLRTYLSVDGLQKAPIETPRRAQGQLADNGVRFGRHAEIMAIGEGVETMLSLRMAMPQMSVVAALSAAHLAVWIPPPQLRRLYIAVDRDAAGANAAGRLEQRLSALGIETLTLNPRRKDFNDDLIADGVAMLCEQIADQLHSDDRKQFIESNSGNASD